MLDSIARPEVLALSSFTWSSGILGAVSLLIAVAALARQAGCARVLRQSAAQANAAKAEFLANMSHEIRTPLNGIVGVAEMLLLSELTAEQRELTEIIKNSSESLVRIVNDIFDFSRIEAGNVALASVEFDVRALVDSVAEFYQSRARAKGLALRPAISANVPRMVVGDPARIRQMLVNLVDNAVKFTSAGQIRIEVNLTGDRAEQRGLLFRVLDTGIGVQGRPGTDLPAIRTGRFIDNPPLWGDRAGIGYLSPAGRHDGRRYRRRKPARGRLHLLVRNSAAGDAADRCGGCSRKPCPHSR